jgi:hypothetical protein
MDHNPVDTKKLCPTMMFGLIQTQLRGLPAEPHPTLSLIKERGLDTTPSPHSRRRVGMRLAAKLHGRNVRGMHYD